ncbi:hypothetical protein ANN_26207 [Periplaneta americana]|uniref:Uncharacterized protein n=1 Tax=Periplaneta americana TaxID=6978 RepID=A0ABQ8S5A1_PERAM|nr:hypothetical protein ANN_26207 [Periplaneta americana]
MAKEAFNRKRSISCGSLEKKLRKRLVKCLVWSAALYGSETWTLRRSEKKRIEAFEMWSSDRQLSLKWVKGIRSNIKCTVVQHAERDSAYPPAATVHHSAVSFGSHEDLVELKHGCGVTVIASSASACGR